MTVYPKVVILLLNYLKWEDTTECIQSLLKCNYSNYEILIIDNASSNESVSKLKELFPSIPIHNTNKNRGYTGGVNFGMKKAIERKPEYVLVLNPDTIVTPDFLTQLVEGMELCPSAAAACGTIYHYPQSSKIWYAGGNLIPWRGLAVHNNVLPVMSKNEKFRSVTFVTGCMVLLRTSVLAKIGEQDERFFLYLDDIEYSARILSKGFDLIYVPNSIIYHKWIELDVSVHKLYYSVRNRLLLINTSFRGIPGNIARLYFIVVIVLKLIVWRVIRPSFYRAAALGIKDYFKGKFGEGNFNYIK
ncbi:MAG: glycosyltransferase family 2 protein [Bacteroidota bacterium]|nr:glycosyltransferase family 2 protein [Bacteroidota bacterium]